MQSLALRNNGRPGGKGDPPASGRQPETDQPVPDSVSPIRIQSILYFSYIIMSMKQPSGATDRKRLIFNMSGTFGSPSGSCVFRIDRPGSPKDCPIPHHALSGLIPADHNEPVLPGIPDSCFTLRIEYNPAAALKGIIGNYRY